MYNTAGIESIATITELRSKTSELIDHVQESREAVLIQKNNKPYAVLLDWETYREVMGGESGAKDRPPRQRARKQSTQQGKKSKSS